jgi:SpoVK/Ycf46/Vps4 family AAA+-type ATPase
VNLLFYGPPGTGKSEFAKTLGAHLGFSVQFCGETGEENAEPNRRERIAALLIANAIGGLARRTIVVVDEADDLLAGLDADDAFDRRGSKVFMNRLIERAAMLSSADVDLAQLADQVAKSPARALSFCLSGPPGAGKSAYARHLAERLDLDVLEKRYSDLSSMWLGESEKAIAAAFEEAADLRAFLILDEADSLLRDRLAAQQSWEITQVNEMLTQMERHPYPFACTTNAPELLDAAAARRFLFKVRFLSMTADQIAEAYRRAFGADPPSFVLKLSGLTPADFATVVRKASALAERDPRILAQWLEYEAQSKPDASQRKIGF